LDGGMNVFLFNLLELLLVLIIPIFFIALGCIYLSLFLKKIDSENRSLFWILSFFIGAGLLTIIGFILGLLKLLYSWITIPFFIIVLYFFIISPYSKELYVDIRSWFCADNFKDVTKILAILLHSAIIISIFLIVIYKGILIELFKDGGLHQYFAYFAETRLNHSTWMDPNHPIIYDYLMGRGQGIYLFITSFVNQYSIQLVGVIFLVSIGMLSRQFISILIKKTIDGKEKQTIIHLFPDIVLLLVITSPIFQMEAARFHLETGAFFLFLAFLSSLITLCKKENRKLLFYSQIPVLSAFPIISPIFLGFILLTIVLSAMPSIIQKRRDVLILALKSTIIASISSTISFLLNWIYVGIPEIQPYQVFKPFIIPERLQYWSSEELMYLLNSSQSNVVSSNYISFERIINNVLRLFSYPINTFTNLNLVDSNFGYLYSIIFFSLFIGILFVQFLSVKRQNGIPPFTIDIIIYWLTFELCYSIKIVLESTIQQSSLDRMLLFMNVFPIITFFSIIIFYRKIISCIMRMRKAKFLKY
jgi:hypothetical protein